MKRMKRTILLSVITVVVLTSITGCAFEPHMFGIPQSQWNTLDAEQRQEVIRGYNDRRTTEAQVEPLNRAVDTLGGYLTNQQRSTRYVPVPVTRRSYVIDTLFSSPRRQEPVIKKNIKVVNINKTVHLHEHRDWPPQQPRRRTAKKRTAATKNVWQESKPKPRKVVKKKRFKAESQDTCPVENVWEKNNNPTMARKPGQSKSAWKPKSAVGGTVTR